MDDWRIKLRQFQRRTGITDPKLDAQLSSYRFDRFWFDKPKVTSTVSSEEFRQSYMTTEQLSDWWESALDARLDVDYEEEPRFDKIRLRIDQLWQEPSREDRYRYEVMSKPEARHNDHSDAMAYALLCEALWATYPDGTSFKERSKKYWGKLLFALRRLW